MHTATTFTALYPPCGFAFLRETDGPPHVRRFFVCVKKELRGEFFFCKNYFTSSSKFLVVFDSKLHLLKMSAVCGRLFNIFNNIFYSAMEDPAKVVDLCGRNPAALLHAVDRRTADTVLHDERIGALAF